MKINIYDSNLNLVEMIGEQYISVRWSENYNDLGSFVLETYATDRLRKIIRPNVFVSRSDRKTLMIVKSVEIANKKIVASGFEASRMLDDVVLAGTIHRGENIQNAIRNAYAQAGGFPVYEIGGSSLDEETKVQVSNASVLQILKTICQASDIGFRSVKNDKKVTLEFFKPEKNPNLVFAEKYGNLIVGSVVISTEPYKNFAVVLGEGEGEERKQTLVDKTNGEQAYQIIVDARDIIFDPDEETEAEYYSRLYDRGVKELLSCNMPYNCTFQVSAQEFGKRYDIGDIVTMLIPDYDVKIEARVASFSEMSQYNANNIAVTVGEPIRIIRRNKK